MYCPECRQERLGNARGCALCGTAMTVRPRAAVEAELAHVHFLLDELKRWDTSEVPRNVARFISERYERQARILLSVLAETPAEATGQGSEARAPSVTGESAVALGPVTAAGEGVPESLGAEVAPAQAVAPEQVEAVASARSAEVAAEAASARAVESGGADVPAEAVATERAQAEGDTRETVPAHAVAAQAGAETDGTGDSAAHAAAAHAADTAQAGDARTGTGARGAREGAAHDGASSEPGPPWTELPLPENPAEPYAEPPAPRSLTARLVEETSTWNRVWRPFLYESIMWFVGAFLILSGTLYFVFESWAGMSSNLRSLTVFGMTAGYAAGFSIWGAFLARREALRNPGNILGLIGAAVAPLAGIALGPLDLGETLQFGGVGPVLLIPALLGWSALAAFLVRKPADAFDAPSRPFVQAALAASTLMMGLAPLAAKLGGLAPWLNVLPCALFFVLSTRPTAEPRKGTALVFAVAAPLYLLALYSVRLHVALVGVDLEPAPGTYAPFVAFLLVTALRFRTLPPERGTDTLALGVASLQVVCLITAATAPAPALFFTAAVITWTMVTLARGGVARLPWVYGAYAGAYFSYASSSQLVPGVVRRFIDGLKASLGYPVADALPLQYGALSALPFVTAGAALAVSRLWRGEHRGNTRDTAFAEVLLRATAVASPLFAFYGMAGPDARPAFWSSLGLAVVCLVVGLLVERFYLTVVGAGLVMFLPFHAMAVLGAPAASVVSGVLGLLLAGVCLLCTPRTCRLLASSVGVLSTAGFLMGLFGTGGALAVTGMALCGAAALVAAWALQSPAAMAYAAFLAAAAVPRLAGLVSSDAVAPALAAVALGLALLGQRGGLARMLGVSGIVYALMALPWGVASKVPGLGLVILTAAASVAVTSRTFRIVRPLAVLIAALALLPDFQGGYSPWGGWMSPSLSVALFVLWSLGASLAAARWGQSASTTTAGFVALVFPLIGVAADGPEKQVVLMLGVALAALLTARALPAGLSVGASALYAAAGLSIAGPVALLGLAAVLSILAVLEEVPAVLRTGAGGQRFALVATLSAAIALGMAVADWDDAGLPLLVAGTVTLPLLWTRANRKPFFAALMVPYTLVGIAMVGGKPPAWVNALPLVALVVVRAVEHFPAVASLLLRSREEKHRHELSLWMQGALAMVAPLLMMAVWRAPVPMYFLAASLALMPGPRPFLRVCGSALLLLFVPEARPAVTALLLALALAEHHRPTALWAFFRCPPDTHLRLASVVSALALAALPVLDSPEPVRLAGLAGVLAAAAFLLSRRWLLTPAVWALALAPVGLDGTKDFLEWRPEAGLPIIAVALGAALLSAACQSGRVQRALTAGFARVLPGLEGTWSEPLWAGGAGALGLLLVGRLLDSGVGSLALPVAVGAGVTSVVLMVTRERWMANVATVLLGVSLIAAVPPLWAPAVVSGTGLVLCLVGMALDARGVRVGAALHHGGWVLALLSLMGLRDLEHAGTPLCILFGLGAAWTVVLRRRGREVVGWLASLAAVHGWLMHLGAVYSSGRGSEFILPYFGAASALLAALALFVAGEKLRRGVGHAFTAVALAEVLLGLSLLGAHGDALRESLVASVALAVLLFALVRRAAVAGDERSAFLAQGVLALGYLSVRMLGMGAHPDAADSLAALVGGALFTGLYFFVQREGSGLEAFRRPALVGAFLFPLAGLLSAPWGEPLYVAALLVGHAAHFAALGTHPARRGTASLASVVAFNAALLLVWQGTGAGEPQYYVIPAGLSLLALLRVFRASIEEATYARLRAVAVTAIYVAGAWKPLMFSDGASMLLCVLLCVVGVGFGIALRIRSYVYLGTAFLVTCIAANLVRFGMRDHRIAAASLFMLGLLVIGSMVMLSAYRAALLQKYARVRALLSTWEG
ncbi:hypothetical protein [Myxococcus sp. RHSTA-1-4]|uniref:hypothetical protein n=1 Tax=Myxococcus sp. RHSTA-1-4 TaxID=2874601 RepID=UPI001CBC4469|nr:hypothetical protein [Myxococcus sp. RHSTA-1-4]MBZ4416333.1 hypothetical protein [Myxococcus sp. RHSTA-1-4]